MYNYIKGKIETINPNKVVLENNGIGYEIHTSLNTYTKIKNQESVKLYIHFHVREDEQRFFGFFDEEEKTFFQLLISVSGIGVNTALIMLSSLEVSTIKTAILREDENVIKSIKGIGIKTAKRMILDLKDKVSLSHKEENNSSISNDYNKIRLDSLNALMVLGFDKKKVEVLIDKLMISDDKIVSSEDLIKKSLKLL